MFVVCSGGRTGSNLSGVANIKEGPTHLTSTSLSILRLIKTGERNVQYGSVVTWGIPIDLHSEVVFKLAGEFLEDPKDYGAIQADSMKVQVMDGDVKPTIQNDTMLLHHELFGAPYFTNLQSTSKVR